MNDQKNLKLLNLRPDGIYKILDDKNFSMWLKIDFITKKYIGSFILKFYRVFKELKSFSIFSVFEITLSISFSLLLKLKIDLNVNFPSFNSVTSEFF